MPFCLLCGDTGWMHGSRCPQCNQDALTRGQWVGIGVAGVVGVGAVVGIVAATRRRAAEIAPEEEFEEFEEFEEEAPLHEHPPGAYYDSFNEAWIDPGLTLFVDGGEPYYSSTLPGYYYPEDYFVDEAPPVEEEPPAYIDPIGPPTIPGTGPGPIPGIDEPARLITIDSRLTKGLPPTPPTPPTPSDDQGNGTSMNGGNGTSGNGNGAAGNGGSFTPPTSVGLTPGRMRPRAQPKWLRAMYKNSRKQVSKAKLVRSYCGCGRGFMVKRSQAMRVRPSCLCRYA